MPYFFNLIFCKMSNPKQTQAQQPVGNHKENFMMHVLNTMLTHDKRIFENLLDYCNKSFKMLLSTQFMDFQDDRQEFLEMIMALEDLAQCTANVSDNEVDMQIKSACYLLNLAPEK